MAQLKSLVLTQCRHFATFHVKPHARLNVITGLNASGKTTLLEAIYILSHGKSFRTSTIDTAIQHNKVAMTLLGQVESITEANQTISLGLQKIKDKKIILQFDQEPIKSIKHFTQQLPIQLITTESTRFFTDGPKLRRDFLNWGLFYTNKDYYPYWRQYQKALAQRNRALKQGVSQSYLIPWDQLLIEAAEQLDEYYKDYIKQLEPIFLNLMHQFLPSIDFEMCYERGWDEQLTLKAALNESLDKSYAVGYTTVGPHRLDLKINANQQLAQEVLSRGQLKLASYALALAQGILLKQITAQVPIYLIDDLAAELDSIKQGFVFTVLNDLEAQVFVTNIEPIQFSDNNFNHIALS